jgi:hypothetical protein
MVVTMVVPGDVVSLSANHFPTAVGTTVFAEGIGLIVGGILAQSIVDRLQAR